MTFHTSLTDTDLAVFAARLNAGVTVVARCVDRFDADRVRCALRARGADTSRLVCAW